MLPLAFLQNMGLPEMIIILIIALLIFGHKLPGMFRSLGSSVSEFKKGAREGDEDAKKLEQPPLGEIKCSHCGAAYTPAAVGAPCPGCGAKPGAPTPTQQVAEKK